MLSSKKNHFCKDMLGWLFLGISVLMLGKSIALCFCNDIWYDELFTVGMIEHSYGELVAFTARDVHPPLYYCITKCVVDLCKLFNSAADTVIAAKVVSVLPYFILLLYSVTFVRKRFCTFTAGLFLFCAIAMPQLAGYTVEIRMYSWALLFVTAALLHAYGTWTAETTKIQRIHGTALVLYGLAAAYTQYFACVAVVMIYLYVLIVFLYRDKSRVCEWFLWVAVSVLGYLPWLFSLIRQMTAVNENYWILPLTWRSLGGCIKFLMKPSFANDKLNTFLAVVLFVVYVGVFAYYAIKVIKLYHSGRVFEKSKNNRPDAYAEHESEVDVKHKSDIIEEAQVKVVDRKMSDMGNPGKEPIERLGFAIAGISVLGGLVVFGFAASMLLRPIFVYRYMIPAMGCFWLAFAVCLDSLPDFGSKWTTAGKLVITLLIAIIGLRNYRAFLGEEEYKALLMQDTQKALALIEAEDIVIYNFDQVQAVTSYYMEDTVDSFLWCDTPEALIQDIIRPYDTVDDTESVVALVQNGITENKNVWFIGSFNSRDAIAEEWCEAGLTVEEQGSYLLERYWFNLYKVGIAQ
ncbi:MAG: hypothetical protein J6K48_03055 [Lachnospiraceae bacterium]|nr:hypothetical protein [Lachnospiraceae bacterium]